NASVSVTLCNLGYDGYKSNVYGNTVTIERKINASGVCSYKTISEKNEVVLKSRDEVMSITEHFNIQVDNPINILNQEASKTFLNSQDPKIKYKLFMHATNLQDVSEYYENSLLHYDEIHRKLKKKQEMIDSFKDHLDSLTSKVLRADELENIEVKIDSLKNKLTSREIIDLECKKQNQIQLRDIEEDNLTNLRKLESKLVEKIKQEENVCEDLRAKTESFEIEINQILVEKQAHINQIEEINDKITRKDVVVKSTDLELRNCTKALEKFCKTIQSIIEQGQQSSSTQRENVLQKIEINKKNMLKNQHSLESIRSDINKYNEELLQYHSQRSKNTDEVTQTLTDLKNKQQKIESLEHGKNNRLSVYGNFTPSVQKKISAMIRNKVFKYPPLGPIGSLISVEDSKWFLSIELCLNSLIRSYIVFCHEDKIKLLNVFKECCKYNEIPSIITSFYQKSVYNYKPRSAQSNYPTMLDLIECQDHNVINVLIDQLSIEKILCIESVTEASKVMIPNPPKNAVKAYSSQGDEIISSNGKSRFYSTHQKFSKYLGKDPSPFISVLKQEIIELENKQKECDPKLVEIDNSIQKIESYICDLRSKERSLQSTFNSVKSTYVLVPYLFQQPVNYSLLLLYYKMLLSLEIKQKKSLRFV
ncbi:hypothetical protein HZS_6279, partial [Henneguya salminicola]